MNTPRDRQTVDDAFGRAQRHANVLAGQPDAWDAGRSGTSRGTRTAIAAAAGAAVLGLAWMGWGGSAPSASLLASPDELLRQAPPGAGQPSLAAATGSFAAAPDVVPPASAIEISRQAGVLRLRLRDAPLEAAVAALAAETGTTFRAGREWVAAQAARQPRVSLDWQGTVVEVAWDRLLGPTGEVRVACRPGACDLWLAPRSGATPARAVGPVTGMPPPTEPGGFGDGPSVAGGAVPFAAPLPAAPVLTPRPAIEPAAPIVPGSSTTDDPSAETN